MLGRNSLEGPTNVPWLLLPGAGSATFSLNWLVLLIALSHDWIAQHHELLIRCKSPGRNGRVVGRARNAYSRVRLLLLPLRTRLRRRPSPWHHPDELQVALRPPLVEVLV